MNGSKSGSKLTLVPKPLDVLQYFCYIKDGAGNTPAHNAVSVDELQFLETLCRCVPTIYLGATNNEGKTVLDVAMNGCGRKQMIKFLQNKGAISNMKGEFDKLWAFVRNKGQDSNALFIEEYIRLNKEDSRKLTDWLNGYSDDDGYTVLHHLAVKGQVDVFNVIAGQINLGPLNKNGMSPIDLALQKIDFVVEMLIAG